MNRLIVEQPVGNGPIIVAIDEIVIQQQGGVPSRTQQPQHFEPIGSAAAFDMGLPEGRPHIRIYLKEIPHGPEGHPPER